MHGLNADVLVRFLGRHFPASREELLEGAVGLHAPPGVISQLQQLPPGDYESFPDVWETLTGLG